MHRPGDFLTWSLLTAVLALVSTYDIVRWTWGLFSLFLGAYGLVMQLRLLREIKEAGDG